MLVSIVCIAPILVSYSEKPDIIGSTVSDFTRFLPALTALFVIFASAVTPITPSAENLVVTLSTPVTNPLSPDVDNLDIPLLTSLSPSVEFFILSFSFSFPRLAIVLLTPLSKF